MTTAGNTLKLDEISLARVRAGAYHISYSGKVPAGAALLLGVPDARNAMDVTHKRSGHLIDRSNLGKFLSLIGTAGLWGQKARCRLYLKQGGSTVAASNEVTFDCPTRPLVFRHHPGPTLGLARAELSSLTYAAENPHGAQGRYLEFPTIDGCAYFRDGRTGKLEVSDRMRGLVCTSYIAAVWGLAASSGGPITWTGSEIASCAGAPFFCKDVGLKDQPLAAIKAYLRAHGSETFLVGSKSHIVLVVRGFVHDFTTAPRKGYNHRSVDSWHPKAHLWTVGKPSRQF